MSELISDPRDLTPINYRGHAFQLVFEGASANPVISPSEKYPQYNNYFIGNDPSKWAGAVGIYGEIRYEGIYQGIDAIFYGQKDAVKYDFVRCLLFRETSELCEIHELFADLHFFIQAAFFRHVANLILMFLRQFFSVEKNLSCIRKKYLRDVANECGFAGTVRTEQSVYFIFFQRQAYIIQCKILLK